MTVTTRHDIYLDGDIRCKPEASSRVTPQAKHVVHRHANAYRPISDSDAAA